MTKPVRVVLFGDFTCPFSYVTETALRTLSGELPLELEPRALELYPAPHPLPFDAMDARVQAAAPLAAELGLELRTPAVLPRTRKAHEVALFAREKGVEAAMRTAIYRAFFADGLDIGRIDVLVGLAVGVGLDATESRVVLDVDRYTGAVLADAELARRAGIESTPTIVAGTGADARVVTGALPLAELREILGEP
ncbi:MAG TPA: DsbA family protein [Longimicrobiaceae bacterium]|nr:DsbA family protein [Longimicrobiaceae bacterium]